MPPFPSFFTFHEAEDSARFFGRDGDFFTLSPFRFLTMRKPDRSSTCLLCTSCRPWWPRLPERMAQSIGGIEFAVFNPLPHSSFLFLFQPWKVSHWTLASYYDTFLSPAPPFPTPHPSPPSCKPPSPTTRHAFYPGGADGLLLRHPQDSLPSPRKGLFFLPSPLFLLFLTSSRSVDLYIRQTSYLFHGFPSNLLRHRRCLPRRLRTPAPPKVFLAPQTVGGVKAHFCSTFFSNFSAPP